MKLPRPAARFVAGPLLGISLLLSACGGGAPVAPAVITFPNALPMPTLQIKDRVINLTGKGGFQYAKMTLDVIFQDEKGQYAKANGAALAKLQTAFAADELPAVSAFNDVLTNDVSSKTPADLQSTAGKDALRQELIKDFNSRLPGPPRVLWVNFEDFVMQ